MLAPSTEPVGVDVEGELSPFRTPPAFFLAALSTRRFCFEAEGAIFSLTVVKIDVISHNFR